MKKSFMSYSIEYQDNQIMLHIYGYFYDCNSGRILWNKLHKIAPHLNWLSIEKWKIMNKDFYKQQKLFSSNPLYSAHHQLILSYDSTSQNPSVLWNFGPPIWAHGYRTWDDDDEYCRAIGKTIVKKADNFILDHCNILYIYSNIIPCFCDGFYLHFFPSNMYPLSNVLPLYFLILRVTNHEVLISFSHIAFEWLVHSHIHHLKSGSITS